LGGTTATIPFLARNSTYATNFYVGQNATRSSGAIGFLNDALSAAKECSIVYQNEFTVYDLNAGANSIYMTPSETRFNSKTSIATGVAPTAKLHIGAGTATAGNAPLKLTSGTLLTSPENGAFEYDGSFLYFTLGGVRYKVTLVP